MLSSHFPIKLDTPHGGPVRYHSASQSGRVEEVRLMRGGGCFAP